MYSFCFKPCLFLFFFFMYLTPSLSLTFLPTNNVILFGDASFVNNSISLTQERKCTTLQPYAPPLPLPFSSSGVGTAFYTNPIRFLDSSTNATASFLCNFSFTIMHSPSCSYGDGLAFLISSNTNYFTLADGYMGLPKQSSNFQDSFVAVEFDTSHNPILEDINDNHIAIDVNNIKSLAAVDAVSKQVDLKNGKEMSAWIEYQDSEKMIRVWLSSYSQIRPTNPVLVAHVDLSKQFKEFMYIGFSASNGKGSATHKINRWRFKTFGMISSTETFEDGKSVSFAGNEDKSNASAPSASHHTSKVAAYILVPIVGIILFAIIFIYCCWEVSYTTRDERRIAPQQQGIEMGGVA